MKFKKFICLMLLALGLVGCNNESSSSLPSSEELTSSEEVSSSEETPSSEEEPSSEIPSSSEETPSSEEEPSSSEDVPSSEEEPSSEIPSSSETNDYWNANELALIAEYAYGVNLPYYYLEGNGELFYDDYYACLSLTGAYATETDLAAYASEFNALGWDYIGTSFEDDWCYIYQTSVEIGGVERFVSAYLYVLDSEDYYATEGTFWLDVYDPYVYEWPTDLVSQIVEYLAEDNILVPAYDDALYYEPDVSFIDFGLAFIYCYTSNVDSANEYQILLENASYEIEYAEELDSYYAYDSTNALCLLVYYDADYECLVIGFMANDVYYPDDSEEPSSGENEGNYDAESIIADLSYDTLGEEDYYYDDSYDEYWFDFVIDGFGEEELVEAIEYYASITMPSYLYPYEDAYIAELTDGTPCGYQEFLTDDYSVCVYLISYYDTQYNCMVIQVAGYNN